MLPTHKKELSKDVFGALIHAIQLVCKTFSPAIETISVGAMKLEELLKQAGQAAHEAKK